MSQPFILNDERLMGKSNHRMPVAAEKWVEGGTASPLIFLSLGDEAKEESSDLTKRDPCRQSKDFNNEQKKGISLLSPIGRRRVPFNVSKKGGKKEKKFYRRKTTKQLITSHPEKELRWPKPPTRNYSFPPS